MCVSFNKWDGQRERDADREREKTIGEVIVRIEETVGSRQMGRQKKKPTEKLRQRTLEIIFASAPAAPASHFGRKILVKKQNVNTLLYKIIMIIFWYCKQGNSEWGASESKPGEDIPHHKNWLEQNRVFYILLTKINRCDRSCGLSPVLQRSCDLVISALFLKYLQINIWKPTHEYSTDINGDVLLQLNDGSRLPASVYVDRWQQIPAASSGSVHQCGRYAQHPCRHVLWSMRAPKHFLRHYRLHSAEILRQEGEILRVQGELNNFERLNEPSLTVCACHFTNSWLVRQWIKSNRVVWRFGTSDKISMIPVNRWTPRPCVIPRWCCPGCGWCRLRATERSKILRPSWKPVSCMCGPSGTSVRRKSCWCGTTRSCLTYWASQTWPEDWTKVRQRSAMRVQGLNKHGHVSAQHHKH